MQTWAFQTLFPSSRFTHNHNILEKIWRSSSFFMFVQVSPEISISSINSFHAQISVINLGRYGIITGEYWFASVPRFAYGHIIITNHNHHHLHLQISLTVMCLWATYGLHTAVKSAPVGGERGGGGLPYKSDGVIVVNLEKSPTRCFVGVTRKHFYP